MRGNPRTGVRNYFRLQLAVAVFAPTVFVEIVAILAGGERLGVMVALGVGTFAAIVFSLAWMFQRRAADTIERILETARRLAPERGELPLVPEDEGGSSGAFALPRAAVAFERLVGALEEERARLAAKVDELTRTNRELAEARESLLRSEKLATVGRLAAGVAHEVGNPLGAISGYLELARAEWRRRAGADGREDEPLSDYLARIGAEAGRIDRTIRDLLDFARPAPLALAPLDLSAAVDAALRLARVQSRFRGVEVAVDLPPALPLVLADEHTLAQVLLNLFLNAGDAQGGKGALRISGLARDGAVVARIEDEGGGIPAADLPRIFDPFFTTKDPGEGTGLGLAICHRIMESYGGEIEAGNRPEGGAVFTLRFRAADSRRPPSP